jgi:N-ethylmaleimide reductase
MVGSSLRLTARLTSEKSRASSRIIAKRPSGVELHAGNGYLPDQFLQDGINKRTDTYGGCIENRSRFLLQVVQALVSVWGGDRVAARIAPSGTWNGVSDSNPIALFDYVAKQLNRFGLAYLHIIEPRIKGNVLIAEGQGHIATTRLRKVFTGRIIAAGGFEPDTAEATPIIPSMNSDRSRWLPLCNGRRMPQEVCSPKVDS